MVAIASTSAHERIQQILLVTAKSFEIRPLPEQQRVLLEGEFMDPLRFRWSDSPARFVRHQPMTRNKQREADRPGLSVGVSSA